MKTVIGNGKVNGDFQNLAFKLGVIDVVRDSI